MNTTPPPIKYKNGQSEVIAFPELDIFELYQFVDLLVAGRTPEIVALNAKRNNEWVKSLEFACYLELAKYCIRLNFPKAVEIATADPIKGLQVGPLLVQMGAMMKLIPSGSEPSLSSVDMPSSGAADGSSSPTPLGAPDAPAATTTL